MARRHRHTHELNLRLESYMHSRDEREREHKVMLLSEFHRTLLERLNRIAELTGVRNYDALRELDSTEVRIAKDEEKLMKTFYYELFDWKKKVIEAFIAGFENRLHGTLRGTIHELLTRAYAESYLRIRFEKAFEWRGFLVQAYFDRMYNTIVESVPEAMEVILKAVRYSNRYVELIQGREGETKSLAHEYLSWLRPSRCHLSAMLIRVTPLTVRFLKDREGSLYTAIHINARHIAYSPYTRNTIPRPYHFTILNRRKGTENFSTKLRAGWMIIKLDSEIATSIDFRDRIYTVRSLIESILRPYVILKDRARTLGRPELRFAIEHCSVYAKLGRKIKSRKIDKLDDVKRFWERRNIYLRDFKAKFI